MPMLRVIRAKAQPISEEGPFPSTRFLLDAQTISARKYLSVFASPVLLEIAPERPLSSTEIRGNRAVPEIRL